MIEQYFSAPKTLRRMRSGPCGPYVDGFVESLRRDGYTPTSIRRSLRAATHLGAFLTRRRESVADLDEATLDAFGRHLLHCRCRPSSGRRTGYHGRFGAQRFLRYLIGRGVCRRPSVGAPPPALLDALGPDVRAWTPQALRQFLLTALRDGRPASTQQLITATRAFVRYLAFRGEARPGLAVAIPAIARWRLTSLPRHLTADQLARVLAACEGDAPARVRDCAIVLLLARLGLRAGDVQQLRLADLDWEHGTIRVTGKGRYQVRLPLPQDVGEAVARYLLCRPSRPETDRVFLSTIALAWLKTPRQWGADRACAPQCARPPSS
jgi:integrase